MIGFFSAALYFIRAVLLCDIFSWFCGIILCFALVCFFLNLFSPRR